MQLSLDPARLVFIDESSAKTNMTRLRGRAQRGERVYASTPHGHWHTTTMISSVRFDGSAVCMATDGATDTEVFRAYVRHVLCPSLQPGDIVIMDNLAPHESAQTLELIEAVGAKVMFLPPYSPDLNPIEKMWSKIKGALRTAEPRSQQSLVEALGEALKKVTQQDAMNWFASCGYSFI